MHRTSIVILAVVTAVGLVVYLTRDGDNADLDIESLARKQTQRASDAASKARDEKYNLDFLAQQGRGQAVPEYLVAQLDRSGNFWFVGKPDSEVGVEIPFEPGRLPAPTSNAAPSHPNPGFLGAEACQSCHQDKYETFVTTAHHRTSRLADASNISGPFEWGRNQMLTGDPNVTFTMVQRDRDFFQRVSFFDWQFEVPFHLVIGSSKLAETYLYWHGDKLFQMNCTYLSTSDRWINSPGYIDGDAAYARPIPSGCIECHATYVDFREPPNRFTPSSLILGISCERCHGPGQQHVDYHTAHPDQKESRHVSVPSKLSRQAQLDVCGQCHTGDKVPKEDAAFRFRPGDRLADHYDPLEGHDESANSVHTSNQVARLALSQCFKQSAMGCADCHDPHRNERGQTELFSTRCLNCHDAEHCGMSEPLGDRLAENCIDCHMPRRATDLRFESAEGTIFPPLPDHYIRVDQKATEQYLAR